MKGQKYPLGSSSFDLPVWAKQAGIHPVIETLQRAETCGKGIKGLRD